ncbi:MAG: hypothetical protein ACNI3A_08955 [Desulfovibrio sp.]|uniref:VgrG-related protein n=1 Tax=Desulfovibrio sp. 7SRBS1 TaxID=3378064 RepID=UPI003B40FAE5
MVFNPSISGISQAIQTIQNLTENRQANGMGSGMPNMLNTGMGAGQDFAKTLANLSEGLELSMVNKALELGSGGLNNGGNDGLFGGMGMSGMSLDKLQMNMLMTTLTQMQQAAQPEQTAQPAQAAQAPGETDSQKSDTPGGGTQQTAGAGAKGLGEILGQLAEQFESSSDAGAIGYDRMGGTSYGLFQMSSTQGVVKDFIHFLSDKNPEWAGKLASAGPANTGSTTGGMPDAWREIAKSNPETFSKLQNEFVQGSHYQPALEKVLTAMGMDEGSIPPAVKEVLFSTAIQHGAGGASSIFEKALTMLGDAQGQTDAGTGEGMFKQLIDKVYDLRAGQFGSSTKSVQNAVTSRFGRERQMAMAMLDNEFNMG